MANDKELQLSVEDESGGGSKKKLIIIIVAVVLVVAIAAGAAFFLLGGESTPDADVDAEAEDIMETTSASKGPAIYVKMKPEFIINYKVGPRQRYLQIHMEALTHDEEIAGALQMHSPMIRSSIINLLSSQDFAVIRTAEGRSNLRTTLVEEVNRLLTQETGIETGLDQILFTNFVIQ